MAFLQGMNIQGLEISNLYWRVGQVVWSGGSTFSVRIDGYASREARDAGLGAIYSLTFERPIDTQEKTDLFDLVRSEIYKDLKTTDEFVDSTNV